MPQASKLLAADISLSSEYVATTMPDGSHSTGSADSDSKDIYFTFSELGIPAGSAINWVRVKVESFNSPLHGTSDRTGLINETAFSTWIGEATDYDIDTYCTWGTNTIKFRFKSAKNGTVYASTSTSGPTYYTNKSTLHIYNSRVTVDYTLPNTAPGVPPWASVSPALYESGQANVSWGAASDAESNVTGYRVQWATSVDGVTWTGWSTLGTYAGTSAANTPGIARGAYEKYRVCAIDAYGAESGYTETNAIRKNSVPTAPTAFTAGPILRENDVLTLAWNGQTDPDGNIDHLEIQYAIRSVDGVWGAWQALKNATGSTTTTTPTLADGERIKYRIKTVDALGASSSTWKDSNEVIQNSNPTALTTFTATPSLRESGAVSLAWSGETDADGNIAYQEIQYAIRSVAGVWGAWQALKTATGISTTTTPTLADGERIKYIIRTVDALGATSGWKESNEVIQNTNPTAATSFIASPSLYESGDVSLVWSGQTDPDANIAYQEIQYAIKPQGSIYGAWQALKTAVDSGTTTVPTLDRGAAIKYRSRTVDALGAASDWKESNEVVRNSKPITPAILFPGAGKTTYNTQPYIGLSISAEPNGQAQTLYYSIDNGAAQNAGTVTAGTKKLKLPVMAAGSHTLRFWLVDSMGAISAVAAVTITIAVNTYTRAIAEGTLLWNEGAGLRTSAELVELKTRVNQTRGYYGLSAISLPYEGTTGSNTIKHLHTWKGNMDALKQGLADTCAVSGATVPNWVARERNAPSAGVVNQVRTAVGSL